VIEKAVVYLIGGVFFGAIALAFGIIVIVPAIFVAGGVALYMHITWKPAGNIIAEPKEEEPVVTYDLIKSARMEHFHLIAGSGYGKSQFIEFLWQRDIREDAAVIVIDSQGDMIERMQRVHTGRTILIDPRYSPSLNIFSQPDRAYAPLVREQLQAGIIELYSYVFASIAAEMTSKQSVAFSFVVRLMLATEGATIHTLLKLMEGKETDFDVSKLDPIAQDFFRNQFFDRQFSQTRQQIARRLYAVLSVPAFDRMFSSPVNRLDMFKCLQEKKIVLVNTSKALLKSDASALFGRWMIAQTLAAAFERAGTKFRPPAYLLIDEFSDYMDDSMESLLSQARKYNLGCLIAHQHMDQLTPALRASVSANTSIKMAGGVSDKDARALASDFRVPHELFSQLQKYKGGADFLIHIRNKLPRAECINIPFGTLKPDMTDEEHKQFIVENNRALTHKAPELPQEPANTTSVKQVADDPAMIPRGKVW